MWHKQHQFLYTVSPSPPAGTGLLFDVVIGRALTSKGSAHGGTSRKVVLPSVVPTSALRVGLAWGDVGQQTDKYYYACLFAYRVQFQHRARFIFASGGWAKGTEQHRIPNIVGPSLSKSRAVPEFLGTARDSVANPTDLFNPTDRNMNPTDRTAIKGRCCLSANKLFLSFFPQQCRFIHPFLRPLPCPIPRPLPRPPRPLLINSLPLSTWHINTSATSSARQPLLQLAQFPY